MDVPVDSRILATFVRLVTAQRAFSVEIVRCVLHVEPGIQEGELTGKVVDLKSGVECTCIGATVVDRNTGSHDAGLAQTSVDIGNG